MKNMCGMVSVKREEREMGMQKESREIAPEVEGREMKKRHWGG